MDIGLAIKIIIAILLLPPLVYSVLRMFEKFRPSKIKKIETGIKIKIYSSFILPSILIISVLIFYVLNYNSGWDWFIFGLIIVIFLSLPAILIEHFISYWVKIRIDEIDNNWKERSICIYFKSGQKLILNKENITTVFHYKINNDREMLPWGSFSYLKITTKDSKTIFVNHLETDVPTVDLLLFQYGIRSLKIESLTIPMNKNITNVL